MNHFSKIKFPLISMEHRTSPSHCQPDSEPPRKESVGVEVDNDHLLIFPLFSEIAQLLQGTSYHSRHSNGTEGSCYPNAHATDKGEHIHSLQCSSTAQHCLALAAQDTADPFPHHPAAFGMSTQWLQAFLSLLNPPWNSGHKPSKTRKC